MSAAAELRLLPLPIPDFAASPVTTADAEFELLAACCAAAWNTDAKKRTRELLASPIGWERLLDIAEHHGVIPRLFAQIAERSDCVTPQRFAELRLRYQQSAQRALWFTRELGRILDGLHGAGIEALAHKGPALAFMLYGDVTQRQFRDLDLLVRPGDVGKAKKALGDLGYQCGLELGAAQEQAYVNSGYEYVFHSADGRNLLEVQWRILPRFYSVDFDLPGMFARSKEIKVGDLNCRTLSAEDLLLALCVHTAKHCWSQLSWLCDVTQLARSSDLDWEFVRREAERLGILRTVALNFWVAHRLFNTGMPAVIERIISRNREWAHLADEVENKVRKIACEDTESIAYFRWQMRLRERWQDRGRFLWRLASTPGIGEWELVKLPGAIFPLYRLVRMWRLARRLAGRK